MAIHKLQPFNVDTSKSYTFANVTSTGNVTASYYIGNGSQLTGLPSTYSNTNVAAYLVTNTSNVAAGNISATGNITAAYYVGNGSLLTGISGGSSYSNSNVTAYLPTYTGTFGSLSSLSVTGLTTATGGVKTPNISDTVGTATIFTRYSGVSGDVGVLGSLTVGTSGAGNVTGTNLIGNIVTASQPNITSVGTLTTLTVSGNTIHSGGFVTFKTTQDTTITSAPSGTTSYDLTTGAVFDVTTSASWAINVTNVPTTVNRATVVTFVITQGATGYLPTAFNIDGASQTVKWINSTAPTASSSKIDVLAYTMVRSSGGSWTVLGQSASYG